MHTLPREPLKLMSQIAALASDLGLHERALLIFRHLAQARGTDANAWVALAVAESRAGDTAAANATLRLALRHEPDHDMARVMLAIHLHASGDDNGRALLRAALTGLKDPDARQLARAVSDEILNPAPSGSTLPAPEGAPRPLRHLYTRLALDTQKAERS